MATVYKIEEGTHTGGVTATTLEDTTKTWVVDEFTGATVYNETLLNIYNTATANTENTISVSLSFNTNDVYKIVYEVNIEEQLTANGGDVLLYQTNDDGEVNYNSGLIEMSGGLITSSYLSLFGGNEEDDGRRNNKYTWWGNIDEIDESKKQVSRTQNLLRSIPAISANIKRIKTAVELDLDWMKVSGLATEVSVSVGIPEVNKIGILVNITALGEQFSFKFIENWKANS